MNECDSVIRVILDSSSWRDANKYIFHFEGLNSSLVGVDGYMCAYMWI